MKLSDIMLDLGTGDASRYDAYVQEAVGQVKVSAAIYDAASQIAALNDYDRESIVQEAVSAGLPSDKEGATDLTYEAVSRELIGTVRNLYAETALFVEQAVNKTAAINGIQAIGKKFGVSNPGKGTITAAYIKDIANAILSKDNTALREDTKFLKAREAKNATRSYLNGINMLANILGIDTGSWFDGDVYELVAPALSSKKSNHKKGVADLHEIAPAVNDIITEFKKAVIDKSAYSEKVSRIDLATHLACIYAVLDVAAKLKIDLQTNGGVIENKIQSMIKKNKEKRAKKSAVQELNETDSNFNEKPIVELNNLLCSTTKGLIEAYNNSSFAIMSFVTG